MKEIEQAGDPRCGQHRRLQARRRVRNRRAATSAPNSARIALQEHRAFVIAHRLVILNTSGIIVWVSNVA